MYQKIIKLQAGLKTEQLKGEKFRKRYYRLLNAKQSSPKNPTENNRFPYN
jgi:hypothetical protein